MGSLSNYLENELLDHVFSVGAYTPAATLYLAFATSAPDDTTTGATLAEPTYTGYARKACAFGAADARAITNSGTITFDQCTVGSGTLTHWAICDASGTGAGNVLAWGALAVSKGVVVGNTPSVAAGETDVTFSAGEISTYLANKLLDLAFRNQAYSAPSVYCGLATADLTDASTGATVTEVADANGYIREDTLASAVGWNAASGGATANTGAITFATPSGSWGLVTAAFLVDSATHGAGNILFYENTITEQTPTTDDTVRFPAGDFDVTMD